MRVRILKQPRDRYGKSGISQKLAVKDWLNDIRILSNQINKTKLTAAEIRNSEPWIKISNADANEFAAELKKGDKVVTKSGLHAKVLELTDEQTCILESGAGKMKFERASISMELSQKLQSK